MSEIWNLSTICRCCHSDGNFKSLREPYRLGEDIVIYESMLRDVFAIAIFQITTATFEASYTICDRCLERVRDAASFKRQVLECEQKFHVYCKNEQFLIPPVETVVKVEDIVNNAKEDVHNDGDHSSKDYEKRATELKKEYEIEVDIQKEMPSDDTEDSYEDNQDGELWEEVKIEKEILPNLSKNEVANKNDKQTINLTNIKKENGKISEAYTLIQSKLIGKTRSYTCKKCQLKFENKDSIKKHIFTAHKDVTSYKCKLCHNVFLTKNAINSHKKLHEAKCKTDKGQVSPRDARKREIVGKIAKLTNGKSDGKRRRFQCEICNKFLLHRSSLKKHMKWHNGTNKSELCEQCGRGFNDRSNLRIHINTVHEKLRLYGCDVCGGTYTSKKIVQKHILAHMYGKYPKTIKQHQCDKCEKCFKHYKSLKWHQLRHENKVPCTACKMVFDNRAAYEAHTHEAKYICHICNKELSSTFTLNRHINAHNGIKRFTCDKCPLKFIDKAQLKRHASRIHNPDNPGPARFPCTVCNRHVMDIDKHMHSHEFKKFSCTHCTNSYVENKSLQRHMQAIHFGKVYACDVCNKKFISLRSVSRHKARVHKLLKTEKDNDDGLNNVTEVLDIEFNPEEPVD